MSAPTCRAQCGACCIAPSISSALPGMPHGKAAGEHCIHLSTTLQCMIFDRPERPAVCAGLQPSTEMCGTTREYALTWLTRLERETAPALPVR